MPLPKERIYTIDDIYALPDGERAELIDGQIDHPPHSSTSAANLSNYHFRIIIRHDDTLPVPGILRI